MKFASSRRRFLLAGATAGGLLLGYGLFKPRDLLGTGNVFPVSGDEVALNAWLKIDNDGILTVAVPRAEMGQGVYTALPMLVAEELDIAWENVRVEQAPIASVYGNIVTLVDSSLFDTHDHGWLAGGMRWTLARSARALAVQVTGGSSSVRDAWLPMRTAGATARDMLIRAAAVRLDVAPEALSARDGMVVDSESGRSLAYGTIAAEAALLPPATQVTLRPSASYRHLGKPRPRLDIPAKTNGSAEFGIDIHDENMLFAAIRHAPVLGGQIGDVDLAAIEARSGVVKALRMDDAVVAIGKTWWHAENSLRQTQIEFIDGPYASASSASMAAACAEALDANDGFGHENKGDALAQLGAADVIRADYQVPLLAHACLEPMNCTVRIDAGGAEIWCGNQAPDILRKLAADHLGIDAENVVFHSPLLGGGFGRRAEPDAMMRALKIAATLRGQTVKLVYSREEDIQHDMYRPAVASRFAARLDANGRISAWHNHIASPSVTQAVVGRMFPSLPLGGPDKTNAEGAAFLPYDVPHRRVEHTPVPSPVPVGFWRSVGHSYNAFFSECFIDELATACATDPIEFRLRHLQERPRERQVLTLARNLSDWSAPLAENRARGVALHESYGSIVAQVAEISLVDGRIKIHRVVCVIDCGQVVNPDIVIAQMESGIVYGLTAALYGDVKVADGRIQQWNFPDYRMLSMDEMPVIQTHVVESGAAPGGAGEPGTPPIAPAVANALANLQGVRQRRLPLKSESHKLT
jgi:isoquinoline 1-oxidoreductase subunit beta